MRGRVGHGRVIEDGPERDDEHGDQEEVDDDADDGKDDGDGLEVVEHQWRQDGPDADGQKGPQLDERREGGGEVGADGDDGGEVAGAGDKAEDAGERGDAHRRPGRDVDEVGPNDEHDAEQGVTDEAGHHAGKRMAQTADASVREFAPQDGAEDGAETERDGGDAEQQGREVVGERGEDVVAHGNGGEHCTHGHGAGRSKPEDGMREEMGPNGNEGIPTGWRMERGVGWGRRSGKLGSSC